MSEYDRLKAQKDRIVAKRITKEWCIIAAKDEEIGELKNRIAQLEAKVARLREALISIERYYDCPVKGGEDAAHAMYAEARQALQGGESGNP